MRNIPEPLNSEERYLHAIAIRLDALCHMMSSFLEHYAKDNDEAVEEVKVEDKFDGKCRATTKSGKPCQNTAKEGSEFCSVHDKG